MIRFFYPLIQVIRVLYHYVKEALVKNKLIFGNLIVLLINLLICRKETTLKILTEVQHRQFCKQNYKDGSYKKDL